MQKSDLCNKLIKDNLVKENDVIRHNYTTFKDTDCIQANNESPTLDTRCDCLGVVVLGNYMPSGHDASKIVDIESVAPTVKENHGTITAIAIGGGSIMNDPLENKLEELVEISQEELRIRKLTPKECLRLMGLKDEDIELISEHQTNALLYHLAGDSIVVNVLMAIFKEMID